MVNLQVVKGTKAGIATPCAAAHGGEKPKLRQTTEMVEMEELVFGGTQIQQMC